MSPPEARTTGTESEPWGGWIFMKPEDVPPGWHSRVVQFALVPLLPEEMEGVLRDGEAFPRLPKEDVTLLRFVASGAPVTEIARELQLPLRSVQRRLAAYRKRFGVATTAELGAFLAERGF